MKKYLNGNQISGSIAKYALKNKKEIKEKASTRIRTSRDFLKNKQTSMYSYNIIQYQILVCFLEKPFVLNSGGTHLKFDQDIEFE